MPATRRVVQACNGRSLAQSKTLAELMQLRSARRVS